MVTHDIDEAYLADRLILMTGGPAARVGAGSTSCSHALVIVVMCSRTTTRQI